MTSVARNDTGSTSVLELATMMQSLPLTKPSAPSAVQPERDVPQRIGLINDYVRIPYANGSSFASQFLFRELTARGHDVMVIGPEEGARPEELPPSNVRFSSLPMRNHPGLFIPLPDRKALRETAALDLDAVVAQTGSGFMALASWLRLRHRVPALCVNTVHLPSVYDAILPESLHDNRYVQAFCQDMLVPWVLKNIVSVYNGVDGLVVLSSGLRDFWREQGVTVPIHVIQRAVDPSIFDGPAGEDPFDKRAPRGGRLLVVCRHTREKEVSRLLRIFANEIAPRQPNATLTLVGDGPDHDVFKAEAAALGVADRTFFLGEFPVTAICRFYRHADVFVYTSLSETYGQVISESLWCGLPVVAFDDDKGVKDQVDSGKDGFLVSPKGDGADAAFADAAIKLLNDQLLRRRMSDEAARGARRRCDPVRNVEKWRDALCSAREHLQQTLPEARPVAAMMPLVQWRSMHYIMLAAGLMRPPATINRHKRGQPSWDGGQLVANPA
jgi:1,2-diacylglycerol 3-alpha-glucosyltransferase